ncbi:hypothetical protein SLS58_006534 [Diplodia intermedia]|uniref:Uncharacterized protein n=1 Tax=Diplodia intermedia TaxID=856260 RepID=A0ABR3TN13_9PEZI
MKTFTYVSLFLAGLSFASAAAAPAPAPGAEGLVERDTAAVHQGTCNKEKQVCNYKVNGDNRQCNCGVGNGGLVGDFFDIEVITAADNTQCTKKGHVCHWNTNANPDKCNCT